MKKIKTTFPKVYLWGVRTWRSGGFSARPESLLPRGEEEIWFNETWDVYSSPEGDRASAGAGREEVQVKGVLCALGRASLLGRFAFVDGSVYPSWGSKIHST